MESTESVFVYSEMIRPIGDKVLAYYRRRKTGLNKDRGHKESSVNVHQFPLSTPDWQPLVPVATDGALTSS
jgi:hypothetical protein